MKERTITSAVILVLTLAVVIFSEYIIYPVVLGVLALIGVFEILRVMKCHRQLALAVPSYILAALFPIAAYFVSNETALPFILILAACMFMDLLWLMVVSVFSRGSINFTRICEVFVATVYVTVSLTSLSLLRYFNRGTGVLAIILVFIIAWVCDVAAFGVGVLIGKHKLIPEISPKKTVEGAIGGIVFSTLISILYGFIIERIFPTVTANYLVLALCGLIMSVVSQIGDLIASLIKREYGVKDYGSLLPGHGGIMDRFDSVLAVSTVLLIVCITFPPFIIS